MDDYLIILAVVLLASFVRVVAGFGDALIGMPLLLCFFPLGQADTIVATYGLLIGLVLSKQTFHHVKQHRSELLMLLSFSAIGVFCGALALKYLATNQLIVLLGFLLVLYPLIYFFTTQKITIHRWQKTSMLAGLVGGFLGGAVNTNGPPFVIYGQMRKWTPVVFVAMFQPLFLMGNVFNVVSYTALGMYSYHQAMITCLVFPAAWLSYVIGVHVRDKIERHFSYVVVGLVFCSGVMILITHR